MMKLMLRILLMMTMWLIFLKHPSLVKKKSRVIEEVRDDDVDNEDDLLKICSVIRRIKKMMIF